MLKTPYPTRKPAPVAGERFGRLTVIAECERSIGGHRQFECSCECGKCTKVMLNSLRTGNTRSCGCLLKERLAAANTKHGMHKAPEYQIYMSMIRRCTVKTDWAYKYYGARGIDVCDRWREGFENFFADIGPKPYKSASLDRINNDGDYEPANVRWATKVEQQRNRRDNRWIEFRGKRYLPHELAEILGITLSTIRYRLRHGASGEDLAIPPDRQANRNKFRAV